MTDVHVHVHAGPQVSTSTKTTLAAEEYTPECPCAHRHENDKTVRPCEAREATASELKLGPAQQDEKITEQLRRLKLKARNAGDFNSAMLSAGYYAKKQKETMFVYRGNAYMHDVWRVTAKKAEAISQINNTGATVFAVSPELAVTKHDVHRDGHAAQEATAPVIYENAAAEVPGPLASAAGAAVGSVAAAALAAEEKLDAECLPWVKIGVDSAKYEACLAQAKKIGPITNAKAVYALVHKEFHRRDQECFIVIPCDIRGQLRYPPIEIAYGQRSRVSVGVADITRAAVVSGAEYVVIAHGHPSGKANPSKADRELTKAVDEALKKNDIVMADHCVIGRGEVFSIKENRLHKID